MARVAERLLDPASVRDAREQADMTQVELAVAAGISPATVHRIEAGQRRPYRRTVLRLARALRVDEESLLAHATEATKNANSGLK